MAPRGSEEAGVLYVLISYNVVESWLCWTHYYLSLIGTFEIEPSKPPDYGWVNNERDELKDNLRPTKWNYF